MPRKEPYVLGVDIGTGSTKAVAVNFRGEPLTSSQEYYPTAHPSPGYSEQDPELIFKAVLASIQKAVKEMGGIPDGVAFSSAMHSLMALDEKNQPLTNLIIWSDARSTSVAERLLGDGTGVSIYQRTGTPIHPMSPLCKIIWIKEKEPEIFRKARKFISIKEYVWHRLFGEFRIDHSLASTTGLFDIHRLLWDEEALALAGISKDLLSEPVPTSYRRQGLLKDYHQETGLNENQSFWIGAADGCLANLGSDAVQKGIAAITIGTSGAVRIASPKPILIRGHMTFSYLLHENQFICGGPVNNGGNVLQWLVKTFLDKEDPEDSAYESVFQAASSVAPGSEGLIFLPYLFGERAPVWDAESMGVYFGLQAQHRKAHFLRAGLEGVCYSLAQILQILEKEAGTIEQLNASGGFIHSPQWVQWMADITGKKIKVSQDEDASAIGAAWLVLNHSGHEKILYAEEEKIYKPDPESLEIHRRNLSVFKKLYPALKPIFHSSTN